MPSSLRRRIPNTFSGAGSASGVASVAAVGEVASAWQLASGHYVPAKMQPVIIHPRPDSETNSWERHRMAPDGIEWRIPIVVQGGAWPFRYTVDATSAAKGITIGETYGSTDYGVLSWASPTIGTHTIRVDVQTQEYGRNTSGFTEPVSGSNVGYVEFTLNVYSKNDTTRFLFVDATSGSDSNSGSYLAPFQTIDGWYGATTTDSANRQKHIFYRAGTYACYATANAADPTNAGDVSLGTYKPIVHVAYPGESVVFDQSLGRIKNIVSAGFTGGFLQGIRFNGYNSALANWQSIFLGGVFHRFTAHECYWYNHGPGSVGNDNSSCLFFSDTSAFKRYMSVVGCTFDTLHANITSGGSATNGTFCFDMYLISYFVAEGNTVRNLTSRCGLFGKSRNGNGTVRNNYAMEGNATTGGWASVIDMNSQPSYDPEAQYIEECFNFVANASADADSGRRFYSLSVDVSNGTAETDTYWVYRNTVKGVLAEEASLTAASSCESNAVLANPGKSTAIKGFTEITMTGNVILSSGDLDSDGRLTGAARTAYLGTVGAEIA